MAHSTAIRFAAALALIGACATSVSADDTGLAGIHTWQREAGKTCFVDHFHDGAGNGQTQVLAMREAVRSWEGFTALEYGSDWGDWAKAAGKTASCGKNLSDISCNISARACKGTGIVRKVTKPSKRRAAGSQK